MATPRGIEIAKIAFALVAIAISLLAPIQPRAEGAKGLSESDATELVKEFVAAAAKAAPTFGGADERFASKGFKRDAAGAMRRKDGFAIVSSPKKGENGPLVMTIALADWYGLLVVFEEELKRRFGEKALTRRNKGLPAVYEVKADKVSVMFAFLPGVRDGRKVVGMTAAAFK
ncbi:MAG: hypothetical protein MRY74_00915 [Neomegalonema sp.]|nr:hypothetical protein [Neomegalonema sp.]